MKKVKDILSLLRLPQWSKNVFVFLPLFFGGAFDNVNMLGQTVLAALAFSLAASAVYCLNDIVDRKRDALHPTKCQRPLASGALSPVAGGVLCAMCAAGAVSLAVCCRSPYIWCWIVGYMALNVLYSLVLKRMVIVDVLVLSSFYVMRIMTGGEACGVEVSQWLVIMTFLLALFLALGKRRDDALIYRESKTVVRAVAQHYGVEFLNLALTMVATIAVVAYLIYTISPEVTTRFACRYVYFTAIFVIAGILRYLQLTLAGGKSGDPMHVLLHDCFTQACVLMWVSSFVCIIYWLR